MEIKCTTSNCEHHFRNRCMLGAVEVDTKGICVSKLKRAGGAYAQAVAEFEIASEIQPSDILPNEISCGCTACQFNKNKVCISTEIMVGDSFFSTKCFTKQK